MTTTTVNGFPCKTCTDIDYAKKHIDPAHPKDGPYGVDKPAAAKAQSKTASLSAATPDAGPAVQFSGALSGVQVVPSTVPVPYTPGSTLRLSA
jgi:hypothetical protein